MKFLVTGGAGYIGSQFCRTALAAGHKVSILDNLSRGHRYNLPEGSTFYHHDIRDKAAVKAALIAEQPDCIVHFAGYALVGESTADPILYYQNNLEGTLKLLQARAAAGSSAVLVFSSSCAVYGTPAKLPIDERCTQTPVSPYGWSKKMCEQVIHDTCVGNGLRAACLRYFNACGAELDGGFGEDHAPETHLIPNVINAGLTGRAVTIHGDQFPTADGTCVRDYIHTIDLALAHILAAEKLVRGQDGDFVAYNLGTGKGYSVKEIIDAIGREMGQAITAEIGPPRAGDPPQLFADTQLAHKELGFTAQFSDLKTIVASALKWHKEGQAKRRSHANVSG